MDEKVIQFEKAHATLVYTETKDFTGRARPKLYIQAMDAYRYQRELSIQLRHRPGDSNDLYWEVHTYQHPGQHEVREVSKDVATRLINRIIELGETYPALLFNEANERQPRSEGFVHFHNALLWGAEPSVKLLG
jgi:hypothetical protein